MALPPEDYEIAVENADAHIQLAIEDVTTAYPIATVSGPIVRVFRGNPELLNRHASLQVHYYVPGESIVRPGGPGRRPLADIRVGRVVDALINTRAGAIQVAPGLYTMVDDPTDQPQYVVRLPLHERPRDGWKRWLPWIALGLALVGGSCFVGLR